MTERAARHVRRALVALAVAGLGAWLATGGVRRFAPRNLDVVEDGRIWRSGQIHRRLLADTVEDLGVDVVLDLAPPHPTNVEERTDDAVERAVLERLGVEHVEARTLDGHGLGEVEDYVDALASLHEALRADRRVLVHCGAGSERTGAVVAWYRMLFQGWEGGRAYEEYLAYRKRPPKDRRLPDYMAAHEADLVEGLRGRGVPVPHPRPAVPFGPRAEAP